MSDERAPFEEEFPWLADDEGPEAEESTDGIEAASAGDDAGGTDSSPAQGDLQAFIRSIAASRQAQACLVAVDPQWDEDLATVSDELDRLYPAQQEEPQNPALRRLALMRNTDAQNAMAEAAQAAKFLSEFEYGKAPDQAFDLAWSDARLEAERLRAKVYAASQHEEKARDERRLAELDTPGGKGLIQRFIAANQHRQYIRQIAQSARSLCDDAG